MLQAFFYAVIVCLSASPRSYLKSRYSVTTLNLCASATEHNVWPLGGQTSEHLWVIVRDVITCLKNCETRNCYLLFLSGKLVKEEGECGKEDLELS